MMDFQRQVVSPHFLNPNCDWEYSRSPLCIVEEPLQEEDEEAEKPIDLTTTRRPCRSERSSPVLTPKKRGSLSWMKENNFGKSASEASIPTALLQDKGARLLANQNLCTLPERCDSAPSLKERLAMFQNHNEGYTHRCMSESRLTEQTPAVSMRSDSEDEIELRRSISESVLQSRLSEVEALRNQFLRYQFLQGIARDTTTHVPPAWLPYGLLSYTQILQTLHTQEYLKNLTGRQEETSPSHLRSSPDSVCDDQPGSPSDPHRRRTPRALTGKHVRLGTGASPSTLLSLRKKIEERQRLQPLHGRIGSFGKSKRK